MLIVISPAKTLDYNSLIPTDEYSIPDHLDKSQLLINRLKDLSSLDISELMHVSSKIADLNFERNHAWQTPFTVNNARQSVFAFKGDVYNGLDAYSLTMKSLKFAQQHLRILSGLYGLLRPLDLMQAYRLEMGSKLSTTNAKNLYQFWDMTITNSINQQLSKIQSKALVNLASNEYFKSVKINNINGEIITPAFKEYKNGEYKMIGIYAKKARGLMSRYIIQNQLNNPQDLKNFDADGYQYKAALSDASTWVFTRRVNE